MAVLVENVHVLLDRSLDSHEGASGLFSGNPAPRVHIPVVDHGSFVARRECFLVGNVLCTLGSLLIPEGLIEALVWRQLLFASILHLLELAHDHHGVLEFTVVLVELLATNTLVAVVEWVCERVIAAAGPGRGVHLSRLG